MKDSQLGAQREHTRAKYIKADNERFSTCVAGMEFEP